MPPSDRSFVRLCLVSLALAASCAAPVEEDLFGAVLEVESSQPFVYEADFRERLHRLLAASCEHVGVDPTRLWGTRLRIVDGGIPCAGYDAARGCMRDGGAEIAVSTLAWISSSPPVACIEDTPLPHEILHLRIADAGHTDPRWGSAEYWSPLRARLARDGCSADPPNVLW